MNIKDLFNWKKWRNTTAKRLGSYGFNGQVRFVNGQVVWMPDNLESYIVNGYTANDICYSIGFITGEKIKVAPWGPYTIEDESSLKQMQAEYARCMSRKEFTTSSVKKIQDFKVKALKPYTGDTKLTERLKYANDHETFPDLVAHSSISKMFTGNRYIMANILGGGANEGLPEELDQLPAHCVAIVASRTFPIRVLGYQLQSGEIIPIEKERVMHDKYYNPTYDINGSHLYGLSPLKAGLMTLTNENSSLTASTKAFQNMGPPGIAYVDDERLQPEQATEQLSAVKKKWYEEYSGIDNAGKIVLSGYKMGYQPIGLSPTDLKIIEQQKWNLIRFCNIWNFPHLLLLPDHSTDNNYAASERALTSRCALPLMTSFRDNFNRKLQTDWGYKGKNIYVDFDLSVYSELQEDMGKLTDWVMKSTHLTIRQKYELQQLEIPEQYKNDPMIDKIFIQQGMVPLEDYDPANIEQEMDRVDEEENENDD